MTARTNGLESREIKRWGNVSEEALSFVEDFRNELDSWPEEYGVYQEYALGLARARLDDIDRSTLPPEWKEIARDALTYALYERTSELYTYCGLPPRVLLHRLADRTGGAIWELLEILRLMNPDEARERIEKWLSEIQTGSGGSVDMYRDVWTRPHGPA